MATSKYVKFGKKEFSSKVLFEDELKPFEDYEPLAGFNETDYGTDEWFLIKDEDSNDYVVITIDYHLFSDNEIGVHHFDSLMSACNYVRDELDSDFSLGDAEIGDAVVGLLDAIFGN